MSSARVTPFVVGLAHFGVSLCVGAVHLVFVPQLLVELPHLIRFQVEDTEDRLHPVLDGYALLLGGGKNHAAACQRFFQKFCGSAALVADNSAERVKINAVFRKNYRVIAAYDSFDRI